MNKAHLILTAGLLSAVAFGQVSTGSQVSGSATQSTAVEANRSGGQIQSQTAAQASGQGSLAGNAGSASTSAAASQSFRATLEKPVDARKCKAGDPVVAKSTENVKSNGKVIIPKGSRIEGHVTQVQAAAKGQSSSQVGIAFDRAVLKNGEEVPMTASIRAIASSQSTASADAMDDGEIAGGGVSAAGRGAVGGASGLGGSATRALGTTSGHLVNTAGSVTGEAGSSVRGAGSALNASGQLMSSSRGVVGLQGVSLNSATAAAAQGSVITSSTGNLHLDSGTQMILQTAAK